MMTDCLQFLLSIQENIEDWHSRWSDVEVYRCFWGCEGYDILSRYLTKIEAKLEAIQDHFQASSAIKLKGKIAMKGKSIKDGILNLQKHANAFVTQTEYHFHQINDNKTTAPLPENYDWGSPGARSTWNQLLETHQGSTPLSEQSVS